MRHGLRDADEAFEVEAAVYDTLKRLQAGVLCNEIRPPGAARGLETAKEVNIRYAAHPAPRVRTPLMLVKIHNRWKPDVDAEVLYKMTRGGWIAGGKQRSRVTHIMGVSRGIIRSVYRINSWHPVMPATDTGAGRQRYECVAEPDPAMEIFVETSARGLIGSGPAAFRYVPVESEEAYQRRIATAT